ncbi:MAG: hypothetical protein CMG57_08975 [Candidatus Marinimicrobia bacterium]|nr:hypothetical protein [Candidatus Neomarinimicrobiota bacterium]
MRYSGLLDFSHHLSNQNILAVFSDKTFPTDGLEGRKNFAIHSGFDQNSLIIPKQTHSINVTCVNNPGKVLNTDGVFTMVPTLTCSLQVADCLPIYFSHSSKDIYGLVHAGWRGLVNGIIEESAILLKQMNISLINMEILIGPSIQKCCFEVNDDVINQFDSKFILKKNNGKFQIDLQKFAIWKLIDMGFNSKNIMNIQDCTFCNSNNYHSYRRNGKIAGRMIGLIGINSN